MCVQQEELIGKSIYPRFQKRIFFPEIWSEEEQENWGRQWVLNALKK